MALTALIGAVLCDRLDGMVARRLKQSSDFGRELDSLADAVSFLLAPSVIVAVLSDGHPLACLAAGLFALSGLWRLAHFNLTGMTEVDGSRAFRGLPTTIAGAWFVIAWAGLRVSPVADTNTPLLLAVLLLATAPLMLSTLAVRKDGWLVKSLYLLLLPTLVATWWSV